MSSTMDRNPFDSEEWEWEQSQRQPSAERRTFHDWFIRELGRGYVFTSKAAEQLCLARYALAVLALIRRFDRDDLALIAEIAAGDSEYAYSLEDKLAEETGIIFTLTLDQWSTIHSEAAG